MGQGFQTKATVETEDDEMTQLQLALWWESGWWRKLTLTPVNAMFEKVLKRHAKAQRRTHKAFKTMEKV